MMYFAETSLGELSTVLGVVFGAFGSILYGFYRYAEAREKDFEKSRQTAAINYERSTEKLAKALDRVATASERSANEAKDRNGHLAEMIIEQGKQTEKIASGVVKAILDGVKVQNVTEQNVEHQTVKER